MKEIHDLLQRQDMCVLATMSKEGPHCSLMAYITDEACRNIYMITHYDTQKYANMRAHSAVSLLVDTRLENMPHSRGSIKALTIKGRYEKVGDAKSSGDLRRRFVDRHGHLSDFARDDKAVVFRIIIESFQLLHGAVDATYVEVDDEQSEVQ